MTSEVRLNDDCKKLAELNPHRDSIELVDELCKRNEALELLIEEQKSELEKKNRELTIEASLEKVRSRAMAMRQSAELGHLIFVLYRELTKLHAQLDRCFIMIVNPENKGITWWLAGKEGLLDENGFFIPMNQHPSHLMYLDCWQKRKKKWQYLFEGKEKRDWDHFGFSKTALAKLPEFIKQDMAGVKKIHLSGSSDTFGNLVTGSLEPLEEEYQNIISRFTIVFNQAYTRFLDLQKAEAQAREAQIEVALERVRTRALAMHTSKELEEVALELRKQMGLIGQKDLEVCAIHLYDSDEHYFESWSAMRPPESAGEIFHGLAHFPKKGIRIVNELMGHYANDTRDYVIVNEKEKIVEWFGVMKACAPELYDSIMQTVGDVPIEKMKAYWSVADFTGGALVMVTYSLPDEKSRNLLRRSSNVFELAYTRFLDLQRAEAQALQAEIDLIAIKEAKQKAEAALKELQATQKQLIQSEKMASLGELTAGIAHEIQNPLNFVNNFSEINTELIQEMLEEVEKGNLTEVKTIAGNIAENEQKINHHGKRADAIVKGMLQHSRKSNGVKEPTDINALADEYLRLSYHGLRAKDKSFNAILKTDFDETIGKINVVPQDIGRVILNLITNAFYAVQAETRHAHSLQYEPTVSVTTKKMDNQVLISVKDNGLGIPQAVLDKIFQPFFTTKPAGEGTGLGLSMSYEIITKGHGGELKVETVEGEGSVFTVHLPIKA